jgi:RNA polymerase sigma-70 factor (ECF subfamily)
MEEFSRLFRKYYEPLYFFAGRFVKDRFTAESIVQDIFVKLWEEKEKLNIQTNVKAYLYTSVKNTCLNHIKRESFFSSIENEIEHRDETIKTPREELEEKEIHTAIHNAIDKLPEKCRQIFLMSKYDNLSYKEIAEIQNISINTIKTQLKRAFISLTKSLTYLRSILIFIQFIFWYYINK